jgi:hypothetical protein
MIYYCAHIHEGVVASVSVYKESYEIGPEWGKKRFFHHTLL